MFLARSRARRQKFQQSRSLSMNKTLEEQEPVPTVTAKRGSFKHFAQSLARFQSLRTRRLANPTDPTLGPLPVAPTPGPSRAPSQPPFRLYSTSSREERASQDVVTVCGYPAAYVQLALLVAMVTMTCVVVMIYPSTPGARYLRPRSSEDGHWRPPHTDTLRRYGSEKCSIDRKYAAEVGDDAIFKAHFRFRRPVIVTFEGGAAEWGRPEMWARPQLMAGQGARTVRAGSADDVVRRDSTGSRLMTLQDFITNFMDVSEEHEEPLCIFDRGFLEMSGLGSDLNVPSFLTIPGDTYDVWTSLGGPRAGVSFHHQGDAWLGVLHGAARVFLYPHDHTPPGGSWGDFSVLQWYNLVYTHLEETRLPLECVLDAGDILYVPEGMYTQVLSLADAVMVGASSRQPHGQERRLILTAGENEQRLQHLTDSADEERAALLTDNVRIFQDLLSMLPDNAEVQMRLGDAYRRVGELGDAERHTRHATFMDAQFVTAFLNLAQIHNQLGNIAEADRNYQTALRLNPEGWTSYSRYAAFLISHGKTTAAEAIINKGNLLRPDMSHLWTQLGEGLSELGGKKGIQEANSHQQ